MSPDRELPHDIESERCVLGAMLVDEECADKALEKLQPDKFFLKGHRVVFEAMKELNREGKAISQQLVRSKLKSNGVLDDIGGMAFLAELVDYGDNAPNLEAFVEQVMNKALLRISACTNLQDGAFKESAEANGLLEDAERRFYDLTQGAQKDEPSHIGDILTDVIDARLHQDEDDSGTITTHFYKLDEMTTGLHPGELIIAAGRPSMGKSSFMLSMGANIATSGAKRPVAVFSLEMSREQCSSNILCGLSRIPAQVLRTRNNLSRDHHKKLLDAAAQLSKAEIYIDDSALLTPSQLRSRARRLKKRHNIGIIFIDYLQLMKGDGRYDNRQAEVADISRGLKLLAKELEVPIVAGSQIGRGVEASKDNRPKLSHLRESGAIEQDADVVLMLYREEYYNKKTDKKNLAEIIVGKQRNGPTGSFLLTFLSEYTRFDNYAEGR